MQALFLGVLVGTSLRGQGVHEPSRATSAANFSARYSALLAQQADAVRLTLLADEWAAHLLKTGKTDSALLVYGLVVKHGQETTLHQKTFFAYSVLGEIYRLRGLHHKSLENNKMCALYCLKGGDTVQYSSRLSIIGTNFQAMGMRDSADWYLREAIRIKRAIRDTVFLSIAYNRYGLFLQKYEEYGKAGEALIQALQAAEIAGNLTQSAANINALAGVLLSDGSYEKARSYARRGLVMADTLGLVTFKIDALNILGEVFEREDQLDSTEHYLLKTLHLCQQNGNLPRLATQYWRLARLYAKMDAVEEAVSFAQKGVEIAAELQSPELVLRLKSVLGRLYLLQRKYREAGPLLRESLGLAEAQQDIALQARLHEQLGQLEAGLGRFQTAYQHEQHARALGDSVAALRQSEYLQQLEEIYKRAENDRKILQLETESQVSALKIKNGRNAQILLGVGVLAALLVAALGFYLFFLKRKNAARLEQKNQLIQVALNEKELLLREIHHRVKNNLQIISSLLNLQSKHIKDPGAISAVTDSRTRVRSMALIHQNLYQNEALSGVHTADYFSRLLAELFNTYNLAKVRLETDVDDVLMDVDAIVPIGLITNELVANALKYAFDPGQEDGVVRVSLKVLDQGIELRVSDNGKGFSPDVVAKADTFGYKLIRAFTQKLEADLRIETVEKGSSVTLLISNKNTRLIS